jgi:hypothetical protein
VQERGAAVVGALVLLLLVFALGFVFHASPRFPGSFTGSLIGVAGAVLILVSFGYAPLKRIPFLHDRVTRHVPERMLLALHIYAGVLGAILGLVHAAHKLASPIGVSLTGIMLLAVISGYVGRYLLLQLALAIRGRKSQLAALKDEFAAFAEDRKREPAKAPETTRFSMKLGPLTLLFSPAERPIDRSDGRRKATSLAGAIADTEYAIRAENATKGLFGASLILHAILSAALLILLGIHIWSGLYYGLRWL